MKFTCARDELNEAINIVQRAVSSKSTIPALESIKMQLVGSNLKLTGYDLAMGIECNIMAEYADSDGTIVINAKLLGDIIRKLPDNIVKFSVDASEMVTISCGLSEFSILGIPASDFPLMPEVVPEKKLVIEQKKIKSMIKQTIFAVANNDSMPVLTGTLFEVTQNSLVLVSLDKFRLAVRKENIERPEGEEGFDFIVPGKSLNEILHLLKDDDTPVTISLNRKHILFEIDNYIIISRLLEGDFHKYKDYIPKDAKITVIAPVKPFLNSVERASLLISERLKSPLKCSFEVDVIKILCTTSVGKLSDEFMVKSSGGNIIMGFNNKYLMDALSNCSVEDIRIEMTTPVSPVVITPVEGDEFLFMVLPVRIKNDD